MPSITEKARAKAGEVYGGVHHLATRSLLVDAYTLGYKTRAYEEPSDDQVADVMEGHRPVHTHRGMTCSCGRMVPGALRDHRVHVAAQLRAARDTGEQA